MAPDDVAAAETGTVPDALSPPTKISGVGRQQPQRVRRRGGGARSVIRRERREHPVALGPRLRVAIARGDVEPDISLARILRCNTASGR
jgi:hypothetical protein